nr:restriction endonuclease subunit S [uncultured Psychrobacter sp.]
MVPNGWKKEFLGDVAQFSQGIQVDAELQSEIKDDELIRFLRISDYVNPDEVPRYISKPSDKYIVNKTDLSMIRYGSAGAGDLVRGLEGAIANNLFRVTPNENFLLKDFLWFYAHQSVVKNFLFSNSTSSTMPAISFKLVSKLPLLLPPLPEQQKIAKILTTWDNAISTTERLIDNSKQQKKALMQQLLTGKKRLLDENGKRFEGEWEESTLGSICKFSQGFQIGVDEQTSEQEDGLVRFIRIVDYTKESEPARYIAPKSNYYKVDKHDVVMVRYGEAGLTCRGYEGVIANNLFLISPDKAKLSKAYLFKFLRYNFKKISVLAASSTMPALKFTDLKTFKIQIPKIDEQQKIATVLTNADKEIELLEQQLADLQQEKKALMQVLLTGKKRVRVD